LEIVASVKMFGGLAKVLLNGSVKMKAIMILGANVGFVLGLGASILGDCSGPVALWHASATALVGGLLGRWWGKILFAGFTDAIEQRRRERVAAAENKTPAKA
jgi:flagellar motor component MotA